MPPPSGEEEGSGFLSGDKVAVLEFRMGLQDGGARPPLRRTPIGSFFGVLGGQKVFSLPMKVNFEERLIGS